MDLADAVVTVTDPRVGDTAIGSDSTLRDMIPVSSLSSDDEMLIEDTNPHKFDTVVLEDWSETGRGSHVDFAHDENVPIEQGVLLGNGVSGDVHEVTIQGWKLAHKRMKIKRNTNVNEKKKEIEILKRLPSHQHIIQLICSYNHRRVMGILLYPVAVCDLSTFFDDVEAWTDVTVEHSTHETRLQALDSAQKSRLIALGYDFPEADSRRHASPIYSKCGCLISAIAYLHDQKIRHKDLKPPNILLSKDRLWLSDFGTATDFSSFTQSSTDGNQRGTARYFSPEVSAWERSGRAADMFSLGCVLLEMIVLHERGTLDHIRQNRSPDPSFHANLSTVNVWCTPLRPPWSVRRSFLVQEIRSLLVKDPAMRPTAKQLLIRVTGYDLSESTTSKHSIFGDCCRSLFVTVEQCQADALLHKTEVENLQSELKKSNLRLEEQMEGSASLDHELETPNAELAAQKEWSQSDKDQLAEGDLQLSRQMQKQKKKRLRKRAKLTKEHERLESLLRKQEEEKLAKESLDASIKADANAKQKAEEETKAKGEEEAKATGTDKAKTGAEEKERKEDEEMERMIAEIEEKEREREEDEKRYNEKKKRKAKEDKAKEGDRVKAEEERLRQLEREADDAEMAREAKIPKQRAEREAENNALFAGLAKNNLFGPGANVTMTLE